TPAAARPARRSGAGRAPRGPPPLTRKPRKPYAEPTVNSAEPSDTSMCARRPASRSRSSRSIPIAPPNAAASARRRSASCHESEGMLEARSSEGLLLGLADLRDARGCELEHGVQA